MGVCGVECKTIVPELPSFPPSPFEPLLDPLRGVGPIREIAIASSALLRLCTISFSLS